MKILLSIIAALLGLILIKDYVQVPKAQADRPIKHGITWSCGDSRSPRNTVEQAATNVQKAVSGLHVIGFSMSVTDENRTWCFSAMTEE